MSSHERRERQVAVALAELRERCGVTPRGACFWITRPGETEGRYIMQTAVAAADDPGEFVRELCTEMGVS